MSHAFKLKFLPDHRVEYNAAINLYVEVRDNIDPHPNRIIV